MPEMVQIHPLPWSVKRAWSPDFMILFADGRTERHEVKGYMDERSELKLRLMSEFYPEPPIAVIDKTRYLEIAETYQTLPHWETTRPKGAT